MPFLPWQWEPLIWDQDTASTVMADLMISVIVTGADSFHQLSRSGLVLQADLCKGSGSTGLLVQ